MNISLEDYLLALEKQLRILPKTRRAEELREVRQHLQNAVIVNQEFGQPEDEAVANVLEQFGSADALGNDLVRTWQREILASRRSFWGAAVLALALTVWPNLAYRVVPLAWPYIAYMRLPHMWEFFLARDLLLLPSYFVCGALCAFAFPRRGLAGTALTEICVVVLFMGESIGFLMREVVVDRFLAFLCTAYWGLCPLMAIFGAWLVGRWRQTRVIPPFRVV